MIFGTLKDRSVTFNSLPLINFFSYKNVLHCGAKALPKMVLKNSSFCQKHDNFVHFKPYDLVQILPECGYITYQTIYGETLVFQCQRLQRKHWRVLIANLLQKFIFIDRSDISCYHYWRWQWESKISPYIIFQVFGTHADEIWTNWFKLFFLSKMVNHFWETVDAILEDFGVT